MKAGKARRWFEREVGPVLAAASFSKAAPNAWIRQVREGRWECFVLETHSRPPGKQAFTMSWSVFLGPGPPPDPLHHQLWSFYCRAGAFDQPPADVFHEIVDDAAVPTAEYGGPTTERTTHPDLVEKVLAATEDLSEEDLITTLVALGTSTNLCVDFRVP